MSRLTLDMKTETGVSTALFVNFDDGFAVKIDISPVHAGGVERQRHITFSIDRDQSAAAAELCDFIDYGLRGLLQSHSAVFHQGGNIVRHSRANEVLAVAGCRNRAGRIVRVSAATDNW